MYCVAHVRLRYLPITETFIYGEITNIKAYRAIVLTAEKKNLDLFPYDDIFSLTDLNPLSYALNGLSLKLYRGCPHFSKVIREENVSLLHAHYGPTGLRMLPLKRKHQLPLVTSFRGMDASLLPAKKPRMYDRLFQEGDVFLARSQDMKDDLVGLGCPKEKVMVHHSGINVKELPFREREAEDETVFLTVARLSENKGIQYAVRAFAEVHKNNPKTRMRIIGDGPYKGIIEGEISMLRLWDNVDVLGALPHDKVIEEMLAAHVFVLPSFTTDDGEKEGVPNALMEAATTGMPVVTTRHAGIPELVKDGITGYVVEERDLAGLSEKMQKMLEQQGKWGRMGAEGRNVVDDEFNIRKQAETLEDLYSEILGG